MAAHAKSPGRGYHRAAIVRAKKPGPKLYNGPAEEDDPEATVRVKAFFERMGIRPPGSD
jgi:hypothetical protein